MFKYTIHSIFCEAFCHPVIQVIQVIRVIRFYTQTNRQHQGLQICFADKYPGHQPVCAQWGRQQNVFKLLDYDKQDDNDQ